LIVIGTSAVIAIFKGETDAERYASQIAQDDEPMMSAANVLEISMVLRGPKAISVQVAEAWLDEFISKAAIAISPVPSDQMAIARIAHQIYGKSFGRLARLNLGDCFAYALANLRGRPHCSRAMTLGGPI
jgi:ribonuclease VapC